MKIVAFLQNQWFRDAARAEAIYATHTGELDRRAKLNAAYLFFGCLTGKRILAAFGESVRHGVVWENASPRMADKSTGAFPAGPRHIRSVLLHHKPETVLTFGAIATTGVANELLAMIRENVLGSPIYQIGGPHPAARHASVMDELRAMSSKLREQEAIV